MNIYGWKQFIAGVYTEDEKSRVAAARLLQNDILLPYEAKAELVLQYLEKSGDTIPSIARKTLINRWKQIRDVIQHAMLIHGL